MKKDPLIQLIEQKYADKERQIKEIALTHALPPIKGEVTPHKLKWRGIKLVIQPSTGKSWIEQKGIRIGPVWEDATVGAFDLRTFLSDTVTDESNPRP